MGQEAPDNMNMRDDSYGENDEDANMDIDENAATHEVMEETEAHEEMDMAEQNSSRHNLFTAESHLRYKPRVRPSYIDDDEKRFDSLMARLEKLYSRCIQYMYKLAKK
jgi:hypothetical protein